jgi:Co/Zn/Cd efflux system component
MTDTLYKTTFNVPKMDCPSEERIIRLQFDGDESVASLDFDIPGRELTVYHTGDSKYVLSKLLPLNFGANLRASSPVSAEYVKMDEGNSEKESILLKKLLLINGIMFVCELGLGVYAESMGLVSDSLDMLADASVYGISLFAVGKSMSLKKKSARMNGTFQLVLGTGILIETIRRFIAGSEPEPSYMILVSFVALVANVYCLALLAKHKNGEIHMQASYICSSTDVIANAGVVLAGILVFLTKTQYPDLVIGTIISFIVMKGAYTIFKISK